MITLLERLHGSLLGLATGDAVGTTLEFTLPQKVIPIDDMVGGGPFKLKPGQWTDDTSMALCLAHSLIESNDFNPKDQLDKYVRWYQEGYMSSTGKCFDIGQTIYRALLSYRRTGDHYWNATNPRMAGNGSIMRLAPVPMFYHGDAAEAVRFSGQSSRTTHPLQVTIDACEYFGGLIWGALNGTDKETLLSDHWSPVNGYWQSRTEVPELEQVLSGSFKSKEPPEIQGTGYVVRSLEAALWAFYKSTNFKDGLLLGVNLGGDADTTGAIYGQIAGAFYGVKSIPPSWKEKLAMRELMENISSQMEDVL